MHDSIAISSPRFINLQPTDISPHISSCEIQVLYLGNNRNRSNITEEVAEDMAKSLRGNPIVGYYKAEKEDFRDHGEEIVIDGDSVECNCKTFPYGFVAPDARVWFQDFQEADGTNGEQVTRTYLMTTGYLWTDQYPECKSVIESGKGQSMELDEKTLQGNWSTDLNSNYEFFIISNATFTKLCILGDDVEPCFEGAKVTAPNVSTSFAKNDDDFKNTLFTMMQEFKTHFALSEGGESKMPETKVDSAIAENTEQNTEFTENTVPSEPAAEPAAEFKQEEENKKEENSDDKSENSSDEKNEDNTESKENEDDKKKYELLEQNYSLLKSEYDALKAQIAELTEYKLSAERTKKEALIAEFTELTADEKADVVTNIDKYSYNDIEAKLAVVSVRKMKSAPAEKTEDNSQPIVTFSMANTAQNDAPAWFNLVKQYQK